MEQEHLEHTEHEQTPVAPARTAKSVFIKGIASGIGGILLIVVVGGTIAAYRAPDSIPFVPKVLAAVHAPAASIDGTYISWKDVQVDSDALSKYLATPGVPAGDYTGDKLRIRVLHRLLLTAAAEKLAAEKGVVLSDEQVNKELEDLAAASGGKEKVTADIEKNFGWTFEQYRDRVVRSMLLLQELQKKLQEDESYKGQAKAKADAVLAEVKEGKKDFATIAKERSEDSSADQGGDLGFIGKGLTVAPFENAIFSMKKGEVSSIVETEFGYHIIKVEDVKKDKSGAVTEVHARHILIKFPSVVTEVQKRLDAATVRQFIHTSTPAKNDPEAVGDNA